MNKAASQLGKLGRGKKKTLTQAERKRRAQRAARRTGLHPNSLHSGEQAGSARLTDKVVLDIRRRRKNGELCSTLAREYKVTDCTISHAATGRTWKHLL